MGRRDVQALVALCDAGGVRGCYAHVERFEVLAGAGDAVVILEGWVLVGCAGCSRQRGGNGGDIQTGDPHHTAGPQRLAQ